MDSVTRVAAEFIPPGLPEDPRASFDPSRLSSQDKTIRSTSPDVTEIDYTQGAGHAARFLKPPILVPTGDANAIELPMSLRLQRQIGSGGFGEVWESLQATFGRTVAVKRLREDRLDRSGAQGSISEAAFLQEALTAGCLEHPNIIPVYGFGYDARGIPLMAMKLVRGRKWPDLLAEDFKSMAEEDFLARHLPILIDVAQAVAFAHSRGIIHRDLKPSQVMVGEFGEVILADWGLAVAYRPGDLHPVGAVPPAITTPTTETATNPAGTVAYMAPEQTERTGMHLGPWTDIFLLGGTLYFLLTNTPPYASESSNSAFAAAARCDVVHPTMRAPNRKVPEPLAALAMHALQADPAARVASAKDFIAGLRDYLSGSGRRREAAALIAEAAAILEEDNRDYTVLSNCLALLERASVLWFENPELEPLRSRALVVFVELALRHGDLVLARLQAERLSKSKERTELMARVERAEAADRAKRVSLEVAHSQIRDRTARAEKLLSFMLTDLYKGLKPLGRLDLLDTVLKEALDYQDTITPAQLTAEDDLRRATTLKGLGDVWRERGNLAAARDAFEKSLAIMLAVPSYATNTEEWRREIGLAHLRVGDAQRSQGDLKGSANSYCAGLVILHRLAEESPSDLSAKRSVFVVHERIGYLAETRGDLDSALTSYERCLEVAQELHDKEPGVPTRMQDLAFGHGRIGALRRARGDFKGAMKSYGEALRLRERMRESDLENLSFASELANMRMMIGDLHAAKGDLSAGLENYMSAIEIVESLVEGDPENAIRQSDLAVALGNTSEIRRLMGKLEDALTDCERGLIIMERLVAIDGSNQFHVHLASWLRLDLGKLRKAGGDEAAARAEWERALGDIRPVVETSRSSPYLDTFAQLLLLLSHVKEARPVVAELKSRGWNEPELRNLAQAAGLP